jgi:hypothetical protein
MQASPASRATAAAPPARPSSSSRLEAEARQLLLDNAKLIKDSSADYRQLLGELADLNDQLRAR